MEFVNRKNDLVNKVKFEIPRSSKCRTIFIKNMIWQGKIKINFNKLLIEKKNEIVAFERGERMSKISSCLLDRAISIGIY